ncbi:MAG: ABC transporter permease [Verrucomicrobiota bacterium]
MNLFLNLMEGIREASANKFRSFLTTLSISLGVSSLFAMFAITEGIATEYKNSLLRYGKLNRVRIMNQELPPEKKSLEELAVGRTYRDAVALRGLPLLSAVSPELKADIEGRISYKGHVAFEDPRGVENDYLITENVRVAKGRFFAHLDHVNRHRVAVIGPRIIEELWPGQEDPEVLGEKILIDGISFQIIGTFASTGLFWKDDRVCIPFSTMLDTFASAKVVNEVDEGPQNRLHSLGVEIRDLAYYEDALEQMRKILMITHHGIEDFGFVTMEEYFSKMDNRIFGIRLSGGIISLVSLIVGGVGITNIMLASIKQRIRELGIRLAIGARPWDVFVQIMIEALVLSCIGGSIGLILGWGAVHFLQIIAPSDTESIIRFYALLLSFASAVTVGLVSGIYPAFRASQLNPIEALKYE